MAEVRNRSNMQNAVTPNKDTVIAPNQETQPANNYDSILRLRPTDYDAILTINWFSYSIWLKKIKIFSERWLSY